MPLMEQGIGSSAHSLSRLQVINTVSLYFCCLFVCKFVCLHGCFSIISDFPPKSKTELFFLCPLHHPTLALIVMLDDSKAVCSI